MRIDPSVWVAIAALFFTFGINVDRIVVNICMHYNHRIRWCP